MAAAVATEDARFYEHSGIDMKSLARVLVKTILMQDSSQGGGSTITQQLAKTLYPRRQVNSRIPGWSAVVMVQTKLKEWITAVKLERDYTKNEIMDMYLNSIFFGSGAYGVKAASETFFSKEPADLTVEEAALLVGMVNKPTRYNPSSTPTTPCSAGISSWGRWRGTATSPRPRGTPSATYPYSASTRSRPQRRPRPPISGTCCGAT